MIVVTGGAGFIGSNLLAGLEARGGYELVVCDRLASGDKWRNLAKRALADLIVPERLFDFLDAHADEIEVVYHLGANSSTTETDVDLIIAQNFRLSLDLWHWCTHSMTRLIYASSAATFGDGKAGFDDDASPAALARLRPLNPYGWSKHLFDRRVAALLAAAAPHPPQHVGLKFFNVYGPNEAHKRDQRSVVHQIHPRAAAGEPARLFKSYHPDYADGGQLRDFVWVDDCVAVMLWLLDHAQVSGLFNLGSGQARSFADLARAVYAALGRNCAIEYVDMPAELRDRYQYFTQARMERLRAAGYTAPFTPLETGVARYVGDFLANADPYR
ncbi:MAG: ADP-glyceromanno-heptose 6-epimerase [Proteobacteria bacterium]|nr:ADP-glyceromanno-heptose 6-epimerase [Pseudomonadota bacterium]